MQCPKCGESMETVTFEATDVDRCVGCGGMWFDEFEKYRLERMPAARVLDTGDRRVGREMNERNRYPCPKCGNPMIRMVDHQHPHIAFEQCGSCHGTFFDAGEFRDLGEHSLQDILRRWFARERR